MQNKSWLVLTMLGAVAGCTGATGDESLARRVLGIAEFQVQDSAHDVVVNGLDVDGRVVASAHLVVGNYQDADSGDMVYGRTFTVDVRAKQTTHQSAGEPALRLPLRATQDQADLRVFLLAPEVTAALAPHGISFEVFGAQSIDPSMPQGERAYSSCAFDRNPMCGDEQDDNHCCEYEDGGFTWETVCCYGNGASVGRLCVGIPTCSLGGTYVGAGCPDGQTPNCPYGSSPSGRQCVTVNCGVIGSQGCGNCWSHGSGDFCATDQTSATCQLYDESYCRPTNAECTDSAQCCFGYDSEWCIGSKCTAL